MKLHYHFSLLLIVVSCVFLTYANSEFRIINGVDWDIANSPYLVAVNYRGVNECVGSLITMQMAVTAAHCVINRKVKLFIVIAGVTDIRDLTGQSHAVERVDYPCEFSFVKGNMDIAIIKLSQTFNPSQTVKPISLCETTSTITESTKMRVSGWGFTTKNGNPSPTLKSTILSVVSFGECERRYGEIGLILTQSMICAAGCQTDICYGDSGAPAVVDGKLCAVTSQNEQCNHPYYQTIFTNINDPGVQEFIADALSDDSESEN
ncbi:vitellin-degrading protease-like [Eurosta solidaginis]|uniref:vitellin-degrading protease-like n=1 Tax=Eurosta solidaginis TaxID=178769 RepID=UPI003530D78B